MGSESIPIKVLFLEDMEDDMYLEKLALEEGGFTVEYTRVQSERGMRDALASGTWDIIISDYSMPSFTALDALQVYAEIGLDIPYIIVSGTIGEEVAVEAMRLGAFDYLMKGNLSRLVPAVKRELAQADIRRAQRRTELELKENERRLSTIMANLPGLAYRGLDDERWTMEFLSEGCKSLLEYSPDEIAGKSNVTYNDIIHPEDRNLVRSTVDEAVGDGKPFQIEYRITTSGGTVKHVFEQGLAVGTDKSGHNLLEGLVVDISERIKAQRRVEQLNDFLKAIRMINQLIVREKNRQAIIDQSCVILEEASGFYGAWIVLVDNLPESLEMASASFDPRAMSEIRAIFSSGDTPLCTGIAKEIPTLIHPDVTCTGCPLSGMYLESNAIVTALTYGGNKFGYLGLSVSTLLAADEEIHSLIEEIAQDISFALNGIKVTEAARDEERLFATLFDTVPEAVFIKDDKFRFIRVNKALAERLHMKPEDLIGKTATDVHTNEWGSRMLKDDMEVFNSGKPVSDKEEWITVEGREMCVLKTKLPFVNADGVTVGIVGISYDVTQLKTTEIKLKKSLDDSVKRAREVSALLTALTVVQESRNFDDAAAAIFGACKDAIGAAAGYVALLSEDGDSNEIVFLDSGGAPCDVDPDLPMPVRGLRGEAIKMKTTVYDNDFSAGRWMEFMPDGHMQLDSVMFAPMMRDGRVAGLLGLANKATGFNDDDARLATAFAQQAAVILGNFKSRHALEESEIRYRTLFENVPVGLYRTTPMDSVVNVNTPLLRILGYTDASQLIPCEAVDLYVDPAERGRWQDEIEKNGSLSGFETQWKKADGTPVWVRENATLSHEETGELFYEGAIEDISDIKRVEEKLRRSISDLTQTQQKLAQRSKWIRTLNSVSTDIARKNDVASIAQTVMFHLEENFSFTFAWMTIYDETKNAHKVLVVSDRGRGIVGELDIHEGVELPVETFENIVNYNYNMPRIAELEKLPAKKMQGRSRKLLEKLVQAGIQSILVVPLGIDERLQGCLCLCNDGQMHIDEYETSFLTGLAEHTSLAASHQELFQKLDASYQQLKSAQGMIMEQERMKAMGQMASGIAHDINNTLAPITMYAEALLENEPNLSDRAHRYLGTIQKAVQDIENTTLRLRAFYKHTESREFTSIPVDVLADEVVNLTRPRWQNIPNRKGINVKFVKEIEPNLPPLHGDESEIREACVNIVFNAVDAMPKGGTMTFAAMRSEGFIAIKISDTGLGMSEDQKAHCLDPFFTTKGSLGTGLGLSMVYGMIQRHDGRIRIESEPGEGTSIAMLFPLAAPESAGSVEESEPVELPELSILCVDDNPTVIKVLVDVLTGKGHDVTSASNGVDAIQVFRKAKDEGTLFDVVITDLGMPGMDGTEVAREIKRISPSTPVILLSGWGSAMNQDRDVPQHVDCLLGKPPRIEPLLQAIKAVLTKPSDKKKGI